MQQQTAADTGDEELLLPAEIIFDICGYFTVDPHDPEDGSHVKPSTKDNIRTLRHLSMTCRGIRDVVTPTLYRSIYLTGPLTDPNLPLPTHCQNAGAESLVYLLRTILNNPKLAQHVKDLACLIDLKDRLQFNEEMITLNKDYGILSAIRDCKDPRARLLLQKADSWITGVSGSRLGFEGAFGSTSRRPIVSISHQLFALLACLLPNVTTISLKFGSHRPHYPGSPGLYDFPAIGIPGQAVKAMTQPHPLDSLRTLQVQCESESTIFHARRPAIDLLELMPVLRNASNVMQVRCYGFDSTWTGLPATTASFECWGPVSDIPLFRPPTTLKTVVARLDSAEDLRFCLGDFCDILGEAAPSLEHLEVLLSPGTHIDPVREMMPLQLCPIPRLRDFYFDSRLFSDDLWDSPGWQVPPVIISMIFPLSMEELRIIDSEPRRDSDRILKWLQIGTHFLLQPETPSKLKRVEYHHMPFSDVAHRNGDCCDFSALASELKEEFELRGVQFQLRLLKDEVVEWAEFPEQHSTSWTYVHGTDM